MSVIAVTSYKGGCGKSTVAMNLAEALRREGLEVTVIDIDKSTQTSMRWYKAYQPRNGEAVPLPPTMHLAGPIEDMIKRLSSVYQVVVIDCGAGDCRENQDAIKAADLLLLPVSPSGFEVLPTIRLATEVAVVQAKNGGKPKANLVLNKIAPGKASSRDLIELSVSPQFAGVRPLRSMIPARAVMESLILSGVSVYDAPRANDVAGLFTDMAKEVRGLLAI